MDVTEKLHQVQVHCPNSSGVCVFKNKSHFCSGTQVCSVSHQYSMQLGKGVLKKMTRAMQHSVETPPFVGPCFLTCVR